MAYHSIHLTTNQLHPSYYSINQFFHYRTQSLMAGFPRSCCALHRKQIHKNREVLEEEPQHYVRRLDNWLIIKISAVSQPPRFIAGYLWLRDYWVKHTCSISLLLRKTFIVSVTPIFGNNVSSMNNRAQIQVWIQQTLLTSRQVYVIKRHTSSGYLHSCQPIRRKRRGVTHHLTWQSITAVVETVASSSF